MVAQLAKSTHPLASILENLEQGRALLPDSPTNLIEVMGAIASYGIVLDAYSVNLCYVADTQALLLFPFFKYFNGEITPKKWLRFIWHDRINYEYAEYCSKGMFWHGGGDLDAYLDSPEFKERSQGPIEAVCHRNPIVGALNRVFVDFLPEQLRSMAYNSALGQFWRVMSDIFTSLAARYEDGDIKEIMDVVQYIQDGLVAAAATPITYHPTIAGKKFTVIPKEAGLTFLMDTAVPYVEAIFFRGTPFLGTVSYNAQANQINYDISQFTYGALYADPIPVGGAGIPPTLLMQDMRHFLPDYLQDYYATLPRDDGDLLVKICESFQKSMYCVTTAALRGLAPHPIGTQDPTEQLANRQFLESWLDRLLTSRIQRLNP
ncbi:MAG: CO2 hydration protein [Cyanobacteria bacterium P01_H01_bin.15]